MLIKGICPVLVTPLTSGGEIDTDHLEKLLEHLIKNKVGGLWVLGSTGEDSLLSRDQRLTMIRETCRIVNKRVPVITGTGENNIPSILAFIKEIQELPIDGIHVLYPDPKQSEASVERNLHDLANKSPIPLWLYHNQFRGRPLTINLIRALSQHPNIAGMKVGGYVLKLMTDALMTQTETFQVIGAGGGQCLTMLMHGAKGHTSSDACVWPDKYADLFAAFDKHDFISAQEHQYQIMELLQSIPKSAFLDNGEMAAEEKYMLSILGLCDEHVNPAYRTLSEEEKKATREALASFGIEWAKV